METFSKLLLYLDRRRVLSHIQVECENFMKSLSVDTVWKFPPFRYILEMDVMDLFNTFPDLGELLLMEPLKFQQISNLILYSCVKAIYSEFTDNVQLNQVAVKLRLKNVSSLMVKPNPKFCNGLVCLKGQLIGISKTTPYVYHSVWSCPEECYGNEVILRYIPKAPPKCYVCKSSQYENSRLRRCGEQVIATFKVQHDILPSFVKIADDLIAKLELGAFYFIHTVVLKKTKEVWSFEPVVSWPAPITTSIPLDIKELYDACDGIPWKFVYCMASTIGASICPLNCFMHLKISLLLSLTSIKTHVLTGSQIIHVLAAGLDTGIVGTIMREASKLANTSLVLGTSNTNVSTALTSCSGGICVMQLPLHCYSQKIISGVLSAIESGEIIHDTGRSKLQTAVWAQGKDFKKIVVCNVASVFGTVSRGDSGEYEDEIAEFMLHRAINPIMSYSEELEAMRDVAYYTDTVAGINVGLDNDAEIILKNYFLAARKERPRGVWAGSMESLIAATLSSARLCRRSVANKEDATLAIWLHVSGSPAPRFAPEEYLETPADIKELHKIFHNFKKWLHVFTTTYGY